jgi:hypothetical protein
MSKNQLSTRSAISIALLVMGMALFASSSLFGDRAIGVFAAGVAFFVSAGILRVFPYERERHIVE